MDSTKSTGVAPLGQLLSETLSYCTAQWRSLAVGVAVFGVAIGLVSASFAVHAGNVVRHGMGRMGIDTDRMQQLTDRMEQGDETAMAELEQMLKGEFEGMTDEQAAGKVMGPMAGMVAAAAPAMGVGMLVSWILSLLAYAYYAIVAVEGKDVNGTLVRVKSVFFPLFLVNLWTMLRTFIWIPIFGLIPAIILGPRFVAAPLIHLAEGKGVTASVGDSYRRTRGYWGKIAGNMIVAALATMVAALVINMLLSLVLPRMSSAEIVAQQLVSQAAMACMTVFAVRLSHGILQHPRA